jgi:hypothetical protein
MEPIQEKRELLIEEDEIQLQLLQEKIRLKKEMKQNYIISSYIEINSQYFEWRENKYNLSFPETIEPEMTEDENNYIRFKQLDCGNFSVNGNLFPNKQHTIRIQSGCLVADHSTTVKESALGLSL